MSSPLPRIVSTDEAGTVLATFVPSKQEKRDEKSNGGDVRIDVIHPTTSAQTLLQTLLDVFLPSGYPHSVTPDYTPYQIYDSLQAFTSSIAGLLSSRAVLSTIGVGDSSATPTLAILLSILQESLGRITTILFAHRLGTALEPECKMYRLLADVFNDAAMVLELLSPAFSRSVRVAVLATSSALKALCGVAAGSSKASLSKHFAKWGNLGELNAKDSSQETVISLVGMVVGSGVVSYVEGQRATWVCLLGLLGAHLWLNWMAVRSVTMRTLNRQRAGLVFAEWVEGGQVLGPEQVRVRERVFERDGVVRDVKGNVLGYCHVGVSFEEYLARVGRSRRQGQYAFNVQQQVLDDIDGIGRGSEGSQRRYLLHLDANGRQCSITLEKNCTVRDQLQAWFTAYRALQLLHLNEHGHLGNAESMTDRSKVHYGSAEMSNTSATLRNAQEYAEGMFPRLESRLEEAGWDLKTSALETRRGSRFARIE
ncbi:hypothetical protein B9Z65_8737 [Elsinoe australis]|uniref:RUS1 family protein n=1 Tax=Elsinoe australis TaxID=40998 RepID=A0A2P7YEL6_9PEZI|nr:hypothetical protein B9Z65_8737 [Elsinoe australis]